METPATAKGEAAADAPSALFARLTRPFDRFRDRSLVPEPYVAGETPLGRLLTWPALTGFVGSLLVLWGASQPTSPFTLNHSDPGTLPAPLNPAWKTWFFGAGPVPSNRPSDLVAVVAVYSGMFLVVRAWLAMIHVTRLHPGIPLRRLVPVFVIWVLPLLVVAPLFSHDAYSYVAQGEEVSYHINPYLYPPSVLGVGANPYASYVDTLWSNSTSPYGPVFVWLAGEVMRLVGHGELAALVGFRLLALSGVVLLAVFTPRLARSYGRDPGKVFVLVVLNPLVLFHLVAGEHNDAIMMGLLVAGLSIARERPKWAPVAGIILCSLAALVKIPAEIAVLYIGWDWIGEGAPWKRRLRPTAIALAISAGVMTLVTWIVGFGWGWVSALGNPSTVTSWMDPATGLGDLLGHILSGVGLGQHTSDIKLVFTLLAAGIGAVIAVRLLVRANGAGSIRAMGLTLFAAVVCSPVVQPWYFVWGAVLAAVVAERRLRVGLVSVSVVMAFLGLPGGKKFVAELQAANPLVVAASVLALMVVGALIFGPEIRSALEDRRRLLLAATEERLAARGGVALARDGMEV